MRRVEELHHDPYLVIPSEVEEPLTLTGILSPEDKVRGVSTPLDMTKKRATPAVSNLVDDRLRAAEKFLHEQIPITRAMGLRVVAHDEKGFVVEAPVALNSNHLRTAFGGSINAVATLAAYGFLWLELDDAAIHVVVAESSIRFLRPVRETIRAICLDPAPDELAAFQSQFAEKGKARITLHVKVTEAGETAAEFEGIFVARSE
jgi:thioesterase domain-containing protein